MCVPKPLGGKGFIETPPQEVSLWEGFTFWNQPLGGFPFKTIPGMGIAFKTLLREGFTFYKGSL